MQQTLAASRQVSPSNSCTIPAQRRIASANPIAGLGESRPSSMPEIGCQDPPALGYLIVGPLGLPDPVYNKLSQAIRKVAEGPDFQKVMANLEIPYEYKDRQRLEKDVVEHFHFYKAFLENLGVKAE